MTYATIRELLTESGLTPLRHKGTAVLCGAGISYNSGLPLASTLKEAILRTLTQNEEDVQEIMRSHIPFESFMQTLFDNYDDIPSGADPIARAAIALSRLARNASNPFAPNHEGLLRLFASDVFLPNACHLLLSRLAQDGYFPMLVTTNFDLLIEKACRSVGACYRVLYTEDQFLNEALTERSQSLVIKIHGSAHSPDSVRTTLQQVANNTLSAARQRVIEHLFGTGPHSQVFVLGYSFSDVFDLSPAIDAVSSPRKSVIVVQHTARDQRPSLCSLPDESATSELRLHGYPGFLLQCDTDELVRVLWETVYGDTFPDGNAPVRWADAAADWFAGLSAASSSFDRNFVMSHLSARASHHARSIHYTERCLAQASEDANRKHLLPLLCNNLSSQYHSMGRLSEAREWTERAHTRIQQTNGNLRQEALCYMGDAPSHMARGDNITALGLYRKALDLAESLRDADLLIQCRCALANVYIQMSEYHTSVEFAGRAIADTEDNPSPSLLKARARCHAHLCRAYAGLGQNDKAREHGLKSRELGRQLDDSDEDCASSVTLAKAFAAAGEHDMAIHYYQQALMAVGKNGGSRLFELACHFELGVLRFREIEEKGVFSLWSGERCARHFERALEIIRDLGNEGAEAECRYYYGCLWYNLGRLTEAQENLARAVDIFRRQCRAEEQNAAERQLQAVCEALASR